MNVFDKLLELAWNFSLACSI